MSLIIDEDLMTDVEPVLVIRQYFTRLLLCDMCKIKTSPGVSPGEEIFNCYPGLCTGKTRCLLRLSQQIGGSGFQVGQQGVNFGFIGGGEDGVEGVTNRAADATPRGQVRFSFPVLGQV